MQKHLAVAVLFIIRHLHIEKKVLRNLFFCAAGCVILAWILLDTERVSTMMQNLWGLISPFVIFVLFAGSFIYSNILNYIGLDFEELRFIKKLLTWGLFIIVAGLTFSAMYKFIPNYKVRYGLAFRAAMIAAIAFSAVQFLYLETQLLVSRLNGIYGTFAAVPLFMIWLNISWNIILIGAEVSYAFQHVEESNLDE